MIGLPPRDAADLDWYLGQGQEVFGRSPTGAMLDRADMFRMPRCYDPELLAEEAARRPCDPLPGALTAQPTAPKQASAGYLPDEGALRRAARVSRRLASVGSRDTQAAATLVAYYGDQGARWGCTEYGRIFAVLEMTKAGARILDRVEADRVRRGWPDLGTSRAERLAVQANLQKTRGEAWRRKLLDQARSEALSMLTHACKIWLEVDRG